METLKNDKFVRCVFIIALIGCILSVAFQAWRNSTKTTLHSYEGAEVVYEVPEE